MAQPGDQIFLIADQGLSDPAMAFGLDGFGFSFRLMEMTE